MGKKYNLGDTWQIIGKNKIRSSRRLREYQGYKDDEDDIDESTISVIETEEAAVMHEDTNLDEQKESPVSTADILQEITVSEVPVCQSPESGNDSFDDGSACAVDIIEFDCIPKKEPDISEHTDHDMHKETDTCRSTTIDTVPASAELIPQSTDAVPIASEHSGNINCQAQDESLVFDVIRRSQHEQTDSVCDSTPESHDAAEVRAVAKRRRNTPNTGQVTTDDTATPMTIAKLVIKEHPMIKYRKRILIYGYDKQPVYVVIDEDELNCYILQHYSSFFQRRGNPGLITSTSTMIGFMLDNIKEAAMNEVEERYLATRDSILDIQTGKVLELTPDIPLTYYLNVEYDRRIFSHPVFDDFLDVASDGNDDFIRAVWEMLAFYLFPCPTNKHFFVLMGRSNSGKSVLTGFIQSFFSEGDISNLSLQDFGDKFASGTLANSRINIEADLPEAVINKRSMSLLKKITGGDKIQANQKYKQSYTWKPKAKLLFATNFPLHLHGNDEAFTNRLHIIQFNVVIPKGERDLRLQERLQKEKSAIFNTAYRYYCELCENGFNFTEVDLPEDTVTFDENAEDYLQIIQEFFDEQLEYTREPADTVYTSDMEERYIQFCELRGMSRKDIPDFAQGFSKFIGTSMMDAVRSVRRGPGKHRGYSALRFKNM